MKTLAVVGLGYVGLGLAFELSKTYKVIGYDISKKRINELRDNYDKNLLLSKQDLLKSKIQYTDSLKDIEVANFYIVTVSTPAYYYQLPNLKPLINATKDLATVLKKGDVVVFESTVYPGTTEEICLPLLEEISKLKVGVDFNIGYSPERVNPNDTVHTLKNVPKIISAQNNETLNKVREVYQSCCDNVYPVSNIKTAEAVKILENTQRDINIAFMNEFAEIMHALKLNVHEIIEAAKTKWSFLPFKPGFVGGHCISIDPVYLSFKAERLGANHNLIDTARKVNNNCTQFVARELSKMMINTQTSLQNSTIGIFGITYKENIPDIRNSLALKLIKELKIANYDCIVNDPFANKEVVKKKYGIELIDFDELNNLSAAIIVVGHEYYAKMGYDNFVRKLGNHKIIMDIPNLFIDHYNDHAGVNYWCL